MAITPNLIRVFVASPSDVADERDALRNVVDELNVTLGDANNIRLELIRWETHVRPGFGKDAQDVINKQIGDNYDIFIGIMWGRFGSPTIDSESGTEEEFQRAYSQLKNPKRKTEIMFYFKDAGIPPSKVNPDQLDKVQKFKTEIDEKYGGLYHLFETTEDFTTKIRMHLSRAVQNWSTAQPSKVDDESIIATPVATPASPKVENPLAHLSELVDDDEEGLFELSERGRDSMEAVLSILIKISEATEELGTRIGQRTDEMTQLAASGSKPDLNSAKHITNKAAHDMELYVSRLSVEIPEFHNQFSVAMDSFEKVALISISDLQDNPEELDSTLTQIAESRSEIMNTYQSLIEFRQTVSRLPRMTTAFRRARKRTLAVLDDLIALFRSAENQLGDIEKLLRDRNDSFSK